VPAKKYQLFALLSFILLSVSVHGQAWRAHSPAAKGDLVAIHFTSSSRGFIAGDGGYLASTSDGGRTWRQHPLSTTEDINEIYFRNEDNGYLVAGRKLFMTSDGGNSWLETNIFGALDFRTSTPILLSIRFADRRRGLAVGSVLNAKGNVIDSLVMRTVDGGVTWQRVIVPSKAELFHLDFDGSSHGWIVGDKGLITATTDGGDTWYVQRSGTTNALYNVDFRDEDEGYAVGEQGTILRTENGGRTWEQVRSAFPGTFMRVDFADDKNGMIVGHRGVILRSSDKGRTWVKMESGTTRNLYGLHIEKKYGFAVGAGGLLVEYLR